MSSFSEIKRNTGNVLKKRRGSAALILLIILCASGLILVFQQIALSVFVIPGNNPSHISGNGEYTGIIQAMFIDSPAEWIIKAISCALYALIVCPFILGAARWYLKLAGGENPPVADAFHFFETPGAYLKAVWLDMNLSARALFWAFVFYLIPCSVLGLSAYFLSFTEAIDYLPRAVASAGAGISTLLILAVCPFYIIFCNRYALAAYLLCEDDKTTVFAAIKMSVAFTKGSRFQMMWFSLSFLGWWALCALFLPIFFVVPYYEASFALLAQTIISKKRS